MSLSESSSDQISREYQPKKKRSNDARKKKQYLRLNIAVFLGISALASKNKNIALPSSS
jgi:hypothetical protein